MRLGQSLKSVRLALAEFLRAAGREIGPREHAILAVAVGVYLSVRPLWSAGALGSALVVGGALQLGVILWTQAKATGTTKREPTS